AAPGRRIDDRLPRRLGGAALGDRRPEVGLRWAVFERMRQGDDGAQLLERRTALATLAQVRLEGGAFGAIQLAVQVFGQTVLPGVLGVHLPLLLQVTAQEHPRAVELGCSGSSSAPSCREHPRAVELGLRRPDADPEASRDLLVF